MFWFLLFGKPMFTLSTVFVTSRGKGPRPKLIIYEHESDKNKKCLSASNFGTLSVDFSASASH